MALDGITLHFIKKELEESALGARVEKVYQPSKAEIVLQLRQRSGARKLFLSAESASPRIHFTDYPTDNPQKPPMLCMLLRKHLTGSILKNIRQNGLDRILFLDFDGANEIGDRVLLTLCIEITGQHSNIILMQENGRILDAVKRVDETKSAYREVLPNVTYVLPPAQGKLNLLKTTAKEAAEKVLSFKESLLPSAFMKALEGISPIVSRELAYRVAGDIDTRACDASLEATEKVLESLQALLEEKVQPCIVKNDEGKAFDFSFWDIQQYGAFYEKKTYESFSELLDAFYFEREKELRNKRRAGDLMKHVRTLKERAVRKINNREAELSACAGMEEMRLKAELITANQYALEKGNAVYEVPNYYENNEILKIQVDPALTPTQNAQKFYKAYRKSRTAEKALYKLIEEGKQEYLYLDSVLDALSRADNDSDLALIREELIDGGYVKHKKGGKQRLPKALPPYEFKTTDGFTVLIGRNNVQNDKLTLKTAKNYDMWLHTQGFAGSHTVIIADRREITDQAIVEAAEMAAYFSSAGDAQKVPVDYTLIKNVKKPSGAKPGKVIYNVYNTVYVTPKAPKELELK